MILALISDPLDLWMNPWILSPRSTQFQGTTNSDSDWQLLTDIIKLNQSGVQSLQDHLPLQLPRHQHNILDSLFQLKLNKHGIYFPNSFNSRSTCPPYCGSVETTSPRLSLLYFNEDSTKLFFFHDLVWLSLSLWYHNAESNILETKTVFHEH